MSLKVLLGKRDLLVDGSPALLYDTPRTRLQRLRFFTPLP